MPPPRKPIDRFSWELLRILNDSLIQPRLNREIFDTRVVATLSRAHHVRDLLFRDYRQAGEQWLATLDDGTQVKFEDEATRYFYTHMSYRLALAPKPKQLPAALHVTNMHRLFLLLCRQSASTRWQHGRIERSPQCPVQRCERDVFGPVSETLAERCEACEHDDFGELARVRRRESGPIWLVLEDAAVQMPEQMSLLDVLHALPLPLAAGFAGDKDVQLYLTRVLNSVNERYALVRGCGLPLEPWLERNYPSLGALKDLKALRRACDRLTGRGVCTRPREAQRRAFAELKGARRKFAGAKTFEELLCTEHGAQAFGLGPVSLDAQCGEDGEPVLGAPSLADDSLETRVAEHKSALVQWLDDVVTARPRLFPPLIRALFQAVLVQDRGIDELVADRAFRKLIDGNAEYAGLTDSNLETALRQKALDVVKSARPGTLRALRN